MGSVHCRTASNVAKFCGCHGIIVLKEHNPLAWDRDVIADALSVAQQWHSKCHELQPECRFPFTMWNCLRKAGASQIHGHLQMLLFPRHFPGIVEASLRAAREFSKLEGGDYFQELLWCHEQLGLSCKL